MHADVSQWYVLNHIDSTLGKQEAVVRSKIEKFNLSQSASLEVFAPTFVSVVNIGGKCVRTEHPLTFHYVFVKGTFDAVKKLCAMAGGFSFVFNHGGAGRYAILADRQMEDFRTIARAYQNRLPFFYIDDVDLEAGDKVEVVAIRCALPLWRYCVVRENCATDRASVYRRPPCRACA